MNLELTPQELLQAYQKGENVSALLREHLDTSKNNETIIEMSYDLQAGSYITALQNSDFKQKKQQYDRAIANILQSLGQHKTILEVGVGEATTLSGVLTHLDKKLQAYGFDLSWSRIAYAKQWVEKNGLLNVILSTGSLFNCPFANNSIDIVYTAHSIEPNGGSERPILQELYRVARKYVVLFEPGYELASEEARQRMDSHGYCKNLDGVAKELGYNVINHELLPISLNPLNPTAITVIKKDWVTSFTGVTPFVCPRYKTPLEQIGDVMYSAESLLMYPIIHGIPCLRIENGIVATKFSSYSTNTL